MANLPSADHDELLNCEIYDESRHFADGVIWLSSDEESPTLAQTAEPFDSKALNPLAIRRPEAMVSDCPTEDPTTPVCVCHHSSDIDVRLLPFSNSDVGAFAGILFSSLLASRKKFATRRLFRVAVLVSVLLIGSLLPSILGHLRTTQVKASAAEAGPSTPTGHPMRRSVRVLTVMAGQQETVRDIGIRYDGYFDNDLFEEIRRLNPDLKDSSHLEDGQLIRIPLRTNAPIN